MTSPASTVPRSLLVAEYFGPTLQGEGPCTGQQALFIRLSRCNLTCPGCDTPYTWDWARFDPRVESRRIPVDELAGWALGFAVPLVVVTGGEPLLQQPALARLARTLSGHGRRVEVETNGTCVPSAELIEVIARFVVSPKLSAFGAGMSERRRVNPAALREFATSGQAEFKFVITGADDLDEVAALQKEFSLFPVWVMPEGTSRHTVLKGLAWLAEHALARGWHLSGRLHVLLWGDERGR
jgi:organic radical activating enzyme